MLQKIEELVEKYQSDLIVLVNRKRIFMPIEVDVDEGYVMAFSPKIPKFEEAEEAKPFEDGPEDAPEIDDEIIRNNGNVEIYTLKPVTK